VRRKLAYDLQYLRGLTPWLDLRILLCTACKVVGVPFRFSGWLFRLPDPDAGASRPQRRRRPRACPPEANGTAAAPLHPLVPGRNGPAAGKPAAAVGTGPVPIASGALAPTWPFISVIVPVRNEAACIRHTLEQLLTQNYDPARYEVLVVDGDSTDATRAIVAALAARHGQLRLYPNPKRLASAARNIGVQQARGDFLVIVDGHCDLDNANYLHDLAAAFAHSGADCLGRPQPLDVPGATLRQRAIAAARASWLGHHPGSFVYAAADRFVPPQSVAVAYRRGVFAEVGWFDETFDACEDVDFNHRVDQAGLRCYFTTALGVRYHPRARLGGLFRQMVRYGRGRVRLHRKHPGSTSVLSLAPAGFVAGLVGGPVLCWFSAGLAAAFAGVLAAYAVLVVATSVACALRRGNLRLLPVLPLVFLTIHAGWGVGILVELLAGPCRHE
jgi:succinoglycan biosynthesis protein ExoA